MIGATLRRLRRTRGLTQAQLAKRARVARGYLAQLEAGHKANPSLPTMRRVANALGVPVAALVEGGVDSMKPVHIAERVPRRVIEALKAFLEPHGGHVQLHPEDQEVVLTIRAPEAAAKALLEAVKAEQQRRRKRRKGRSG